MQTNISCGTNLMFLLRAYGVESRVCTLGVDAELFRPLGLPRENYVLGIGGLDYSKGNKANNEVAAAVGDEWQRYASDRKNAKIHANINKNLKQENNGRANTK